MTTIKYMEIDVKIKKRAHPDVAVTIHCDNFMLEINDHTMFPTSHDLASDDWKVLSCEKDSYFCIANKKFTFITGAANACGQVDVTLWIKLVGRDLAYITELAKIGDIVHEWTRNDRHFNYDYDGNLDIRIQIR